MFEDFIFSNFEKKNVFEIFSKPVIKTSFKELEKSADQQEEESGPWGTILITLQNIISPVEN